MSIEIMITYWLLAFSITLIPGADWAYIMSAGAQKRVLPAVSGIILGYALIILLVAIGIGELINHYPFLLMFITILGSIYLIGLGIKVLRYAQHINIAQNRIVNNHWYLKGMAVSGLNPKVLLTFLAILPQFVSLQQDWPLSLQMLGLGVLHISTCLFIYPLVGIGTGLLLQRKPYLSCWINRFSGIAMISIALGLVLPYLWSLF